MWYVAYQQRGRAPDDCDVTGIFPGKFAVLFEGPPTPGSTRRLICSSSQYNSQAKTELFIQNVAYLSISYIILAMRKNKYTHLGERLDDIRRCILHLPKTKLAEKLDVAPNTLYAVLRGKRRIDLKMASKLGELHRDARFWIELQAAFDVHQVKSR
jgi:addiction module HigA family antidote